MADDILCCDLHYYVDLKIRIYIGFTSFLSCFASYSIQLLRQAMDRVSHSAIPLPPHCRFECITSVSKQGASSANGLIRRRPKA